MLLKVYGWKGANLIFAGLCLSCAAFGALMRPLELKIKIIQPEKKETDNTETSLQNVPTTSIETSNATSNKRKSSVWTRAISSLESKFQVVDKKQMAENTLAKGIIPMNTSTLMSHVVFGIEVNSNVKLVKTFIALII